MFLQITFLGIANATAWTVVEIARMGQIGIGRSMLVVKVILDSAPTGKALPADMTDKAIAFGKIEDLRLATLGSEIPE